MTAFGRQPTPYPDLNLVLHELVAGQRAVLGDDLAAVCLQGSFAVGDFDEHSDVDFTAVVRRELTTAQVEALQALHGRVHDLECEWARHLEGSYFPAEVLSSCARRGDLLWYLDNGSRALIRSIHCNTAVVRWVVREHGVPLWGPDPRTLVDPVPTDTLRREILAVMRDWGGEILTDPGKYNNRFYQTFIVLSYCRMLHSLHAGIVASKRAGAEWARQELDPAWAGLIDRTWAGRPNPAVSVRQPADPADFQLTLEFIRYALRLSPRYATDLAGT